MSERDAWVEIDLGAIAHNLGLVRKLAGGARIYAVCKGHAYGFDVAVVAGVAAAHGADALAVGDPDDARAIRRARIRLPILLYGSTCADALPAIAAEDVTVTAHDAASLGVCLAHGLHFSLKLDCGFTRLGFRDDELETLLAQVAKHRDARVAGAYTHLGDTGDAASLDRQVTRFRSMVDRIEAAGWKPLERMVASSRVLIGDASLALDAVNPGRLLYGVLEPPWDTRIAARPALVAVKTRVIALKTASAGAVLGYSPVPLARDATLAVIPYGFADGYPRYPPGGAALVRGRRAMLVGPRHTEHSIVDVTDISGVALGDEVVLLGRQGDAEITAADIEQHTGVPLLELVARLARGPNKRYLGQSGATS